MKKLVLLLFLISTASLFSQTVQVLDMDTHQPIPGVAIYNDDKTKTGVTDFDGMADISNFGAEEILIFQHISHVKRSLAKSKIIANGNTVLLETDASALDEIVVSVSKFGQSKREIPQQIVTVGSEQVLFSNPQTAADLLESSGQVYVQKSQLGGGSPLIRGFSTNRLLITVDGVRFNTAIFRGGNVQNVISIDPFAIERTEVSMSSSQRRASLPCGLP